MPKPLVTIVLPTYNRYELLKRACTSIAKQTFRDFELIVVDDGSTDPTPEIGEDALPSFKLIRHEVNRGAAAARNSGIKAAAGKWIAFIDSDDTWAPDKLSAQVAYAREAVDQVWANCTGFRLHRRGEVSETCIEMLPGEFATNILWGCFVSPGSTLMIRREVVDKVGLFDESFRRLEDWDWLLRFSRHYEMTFLPQPLVDVFVGERAVANDPEQDPVLLAIRRISATHMPWIRSRGWIATAKFQSTLRVEQAARLYWMRRPVYAAFHVIAALLWYPARNMDFFRLIWRRLRRPT